MQRGNYDIVRQFHQFQLSSCVELGTLKQLSLTVIVDLYKKHRDEWIQSMPCIPHHLRKEICKRLMYKGILDNDLFSLSIDVDRKVWDLRSLRENVTDESCEVLARATSIELLRLSHSKCSSTALYTMIQNFKGLRLLEIINTKNMDDQALEQIASNCSNLEVLNIKNTNVTDDGMLSISNYNLSLSELDISSTNITKLGIDHLLKCDTKTSLRLVRFKNCKNLGSAKTVHYIVYAFPNLKEYSFDFNETDEAEIGWALSQLPEPTPGQNVFFNIPL